MQVTDLDAEEAEVKFMKKVGRDMYIWPQEKDVSWELRENIVCVVAPPDLANTREQFRFSQADRLKIKENLKEVSFQLKWFCGNTSLQFQVITYPSYAGWDSAISSSIISMGRDL